MKPITVVASLAILLASLAVAVQFSAKEATAKDAARPAEPKAATPQTIKDATMDRTWKCPLTSEADKLAQFKAVGDPRCVGLHNNNDMRARVFADATAFAHVCPVIFEEKFTYEPACTTVAMPQIDKGHSMQLANFGGGDYWLSIGGPGGVVVSGVKLTAHHVDLGPDDKKVKGYAWLEGSDGGLVYYVYIDGTQRLATDKHYIVEIYDAKDTNCADHAPVKSAVADFTCELVPEPSPKANPRQGGTGPGGEPPPVRP